MLGCPCVTQLGSCTRLLGKETYLDLFCNAAPRLTTVLRCRIVPAPPVGVHTVYNPAAHALRGIQSIETDRHPTTIPPSDQIAAGGRF